MTFKSYHKEKIKPGAMPDHKKCSICGTLNHKDREVCLSCNVEF